MSTTYCLLAPEYEALAVYTSVVAPSVIVIVSSTTIPDEPPQAITVKVYLYFDTVSAKNICPL